MEKKRRGTPRPGPRQPRFQNETGESFVGRVRKAKGLTQVQMAELLGCDVNTVRRCEYNDRLPTNTAVLKNLKAAARSIGIEFPDAD